MLIFLSAMAVLLVAADQISKFLAVDALGAVGAAKEFIAGLIRFEYHQNTGMAWGLMPSATWVFIVITGVMAAVIVLIVIKFRKLAPKTLLVALTMIFAGAIGNFIDRVALGYVRDFIAFDFFDFPIFNVADCCVSIGVCLLIVSGLLTRSGREFIDTVFEKKNSAAAADGGDDK